MTDRTTIGDRMKAYEEPSTSRKAFKGQPLVARLDGKAFHTFTKGLKRPYDKRLSDLMIDTMKALVDRFNANVGYVQSDEITLVWLTTTDSTVELPFSGRFQKLESLLAGFCSAYFNKQLSFYLPEKADLVPYFDCRAFVVPSVQEAYHAVLWRQQDCTKNAISMAAQSMFSHKYLQCRSGAEMQELMWKEKGVNFNDYPAFFKRGTFARRVKEERMLTEEQLAKIPEGRRPTGPVTRSFVDTVDIWLSKQPDPVATLFYGAPITEAPAPDLPDGEIAKREQHLSNLIEIFDGFDDSGVVCGSAPPRPVRSSEVLPKCVSLPTDFLGSPLVEGDEVIVMELVGSGDRKDILEKKYRFNGVKWKFVTIVLPNDF